MNARSAGVLLLVVCVALAGCGGSSGDVTPSPAQTDEPTPDWGDPVPLDEVELPPGAGTDGIENVSALASTHRSILADTGYRAHYQRFQNGPEGYANVSYVANSSAETEQALYRITVTDVTADGQRVRSIVRYDDGDTYYRKVTTDSDVTYDSGEQIPFEELYGNLEGRVRGAIEDATFGEPSAFESDGRVYFEYDVTDYEFTDRNRTVTGADGTLVVRDDGLVVDVWVHVQTEQGIYVVEQWYETLGEVTVAEPDWLDEAAASTS